MTPLGSSTKEIALVVAIVLVPTFPATLFLTRAIGRGRTRAHAVESGRSATTPLTVISVVTVVIAVAAALAVAATVLARWLVG